MSAADAQQRLPPGSRLALGVVGIGHQQRQRVSEHGRRFIERDAMLLGVRDRLGRIPRPRSRPNLRPFQRESRKRDSPGSTSRIGDTYARGERSPFSSQPHCTKETMARSVSVTAVDSPTGDGVSVVDAEPLIGRPWSQVARRSGGLIAARGAVASPSRELGERRSPPWIQGTPRRHPDRE